MLSTFLVVAAIGVGQQPNLYRTNIQKPTNKNGYEEYLQAADMAISGNLKRLVDFVSEPNDQSTRLERQRQVAKQMSRIYTTIKRGNGKPVFYPAPLDFETLLPELGHFRTVGRALVHKAEVHFADGEVNQGFDTLVTAMVFGDKLSGSGPVIHNLVGRAINQPALQLIAKNTPLMSIPSSKNTRKEMLALLASPSPWGNSMRYEMQGILASIPLLFDGPSEALVGAIDEGSLTQLQNLSPEQKKRATDDLSFAITRQYQARLQMLEQPEREWPSIAKQIAEISDPSDPIAKGIYDAFVPDFSRIDIYEIARRTHYRLLVVYGEVTNFRWNHGYYPSNLNQIEDKSVIIDPLNGQPFEYERTDAGFRLYSNGTVDTGKIDLFYSPPRGGSTRPD